MALNGNALGTAIKEALEDLTDDELMNPEKGWQTIATKIIEHLQTSGVVSTTGTGTVNPITGVIETTSSGTIA